jgi:putative endopeptidase
MKITRKKKSKQINNNNSTKKNHNKCVGYNPFEDIFINKVVEINDQDYQKSLIKAFKTPFAPTKVTPRSDFYTYINYTWIQDVTKKLSKNQKFYTQEDSFRVTQEKVYYDLMKIVDNYIKNNDTKRSKDLKNLRESLLNLDEKYIQNHINKEITEIQNMTKSGNLYKLLATLNDNEITSWSSPISWTLNADQKNSKIYRNYISTPRLGVYDYTIYIENNEEDQNTIYYKKLFKRKYFEFVNKLLNTCVPNNKYTAQEVWDVEYDLLTAMGCNEVKKDSTEFYNIVTKEDSLNLYGFDWEEFCYYIGYKKTPDFFICSSLNYLKCVMKLMKENDNWRTKKWQAYYIYQQLRQMIRFHKKWRYYYFEFWEHFVFGQPVPMPKEIYPIFGLSYCFNTLLTNEYIKENKNYEIINYVKDMGNDLLKVFKRILKRNTWLSVETKKYAILKLDNLNFIIGSPKLLREDPLLDYSPKDAWGNLVKLSKWRTSKLLKLEGEQTIDIPNIDWNVFKLVGTQAYVVNAYYTPTENTIYVPIAYLQKPFIDLNERGIEYNLAHIGYTLAHEMSHCLDDNGSKFDYKGNLKNWWTPHDRKIFDDKVKNVIKQYEKFASYDGIVMDASLSTGENLADISGLAICSEFLRDFQLKNQDITSISSLSFQAFFQYVAIQDRQKIYDKAIKAQLKSNPHPMNKYRANCPLARLKLFQSIYNIKKGDKMYWESTDTIW